MVVKNFLAASNSYDFLKSVLFKFAEKSDGERVKGFSQFFAFRKLIHPFIHSFIRVSFRIFREGGKSAFLK